MYECKYFVIFVNSTYNINVLDFTYIFNIYHFK
jgi:hypothetical protein